MRGLEAVNIEDEMLRNREIYKVTARDTYYSAEEAVRFRLATKIMTNAKELEKEE